MDQNNKESQVTKYGFSFSSYLMHDGNEWYQPGEPGESDPIRAAFLSRLDKKRTYARTKFEVVREQVEGQITSGEIPPEVGAFITETLRRLDGCQKSNMNLRGERDRAAKDAVKGLGEWLQENYDKYDPEHGIFDD